VTPTVFYLHGFASSAKSTKAGYFAERFAAHGVTLRCPDFNEPDFSTMTLTRMLAQLRGELEAAGVASTLIGSSLGGTLAVLAAQQFPAQVDRLVLLAPAVMFAKPGHHLLPPERVDEWRRRGALPFFHYAHNEERPLNFAFYEDSLEHDAFNATFQ
jgi:pimeloyl-ACP methyl ester carboxylesterase